MDEIELEIGGVPYLLVPHPENLLVAASFTASTREDFVLATIIAVPPGTTYNEQSLNDTLQNRLGNDDVCQPAFLRYLCIYLIEAVTVESHHQISLRSIGVDKISTQICDVESLPASRPYVFSMGRAWRPWSMYDHFAQTMIFTCCPSGSLGGRWHSSCLPIEIVLHKVRAATSRRHPVRYQGHVRHPRSKTSVGSRSYADYHSSAVRTANRIQRLIDMGTVLIGKTKLATMVILYGAAAMYNRDIRALGEILRSWLQVSAEQGRSSLTETSFEAILVPTEAGASTTSMRIRFRGRSYQGAGSQYEKRLKKLPISNGGMRWRLRDLIRPSAFTRDSCGDSGRVKRYTQQDRDRLMERLLLYKLWVLTKIFPLIREDSLGAATVVPFDNGGSTYRDQMPCDKELFAGLGTKNISPIIGGPEVTVIPGEMPHHSGISDREGKMPFAVSITGSPGFDLELCDLAAAAMQHAQPSLRLATGRSISAAK
ncbi:hypothetical protein DOTSEDRAFT_82045 [Dothistroma septosporum NZE10]|uniref:Amidase domain-containing protein n=1 Tax=Dothistroma septosporum (strain NZE10 / CBS 128990) TaxID=675120 RepID=N1PHM7_DOTSN|nr:hypothetical protein DOTSEDRAFT_82045 [Dothistroma septosporum NZE10]